MEDTGSSPGHHSFMVVVQWENTDTRNRFKSCMLTAF